MKAWRWFKGFTKSNQKLVTGVCGAIFISMGVPVYLAQPVATSVVDQVTADSDYGS